MLFPESVVEVYKKTACNLKGAAKRIFMAEVVKAYGLGAQREAEVRLKWCRNTIKKGSHEMKSGIVCVDNFQGRGRKKAEEKKPKLLEQIKQIVENESQADPAMNSERMYIRMTANAVREELKKRFGYAEDELPVRFTISCKLNEMGYNLKKVRKTIPKKR
jgi:hypothetical protein